MLLHLLLSGLGLFTCHTHEETSQHIETALNNLIATHPDNEDKPRFIAEMKDFQNLVERYSAEKENKMDWKTFEWKSIQPPNSDQIISYSDLNVDDDFEDDEILLSKLAVLKLNGGLGTTMGCQGPKAAIVVRSNLTFLDLAVQQLIHKNNELGSDIPLILMNSFNTDEETEQLIKKYESQLRILTFKQSRFPRIFQDTLLPVATSYDAPKSHWYPNGHGDLYASLYRSGILDQLLSEGKEYLFLSNIDNLGAKIDLKILRHVDKSGSEIVLEVTDKTIADVKGHTLVDNNGHLRLLEPAQVPSEHVEDFNDRFKVFNTGNIWLNLKAIKRVVENNELMMEIIENVKTLEDKKVIQLEIAVTSAMKHFKNVLGINVPRTRFLPVKATSDLFLIQSNIYTLKENGEFTLHPSRTSVPSVILGDKFKNVPDFLKRFEEIPNVLELTKLIVDGDVFFKGGVVLKGEVSIQAKEHICVSERTIKNQNISFQRDLFRRNTGRIYRV